MAIRTKIVSQFVLKYKRRLSKLILSFSTWYLDLMHVILQLIVINFDHQVINNAIQHFFSIIFIFFNLLKIYFEQLQIKVRYQIFESFLIILVAWYDYVEILCDNDFRHLFSPHVYLLLK